MGSSKNFSFQFKCFGDPTTFFSREIPKKTMYIYELYLRFVLIFFEMWGFLPNFNIAHGNNNKFVIK